MKPPEEIKGELIRQWLSRADEDIGVAQHLVSSETVYFATVGFHAQQAAEKYLKAFLVQQQIEFRKTHDLGAILDVVSSADPTLADSLREVTALNPYGVDVRYPGDVPEMTTREDAERALAMAEKVRKAVLPFLK